MLSDDFCERVAACRPARPTTFNESEWVCQIKTHFQIFDWKQPPNTSQAAAGTGTGFLVRDMCTGSGAREGAEADDDDDDDDDDDVYIVTAYHVVANARQIRSLFAKSSHEVDTPLVGANPALDVALLRLSRANFSTAFPNSKGKMREAGIRCGNSDVVRSGDSVTAHGYARGDSHIQMTAGVISGRISDPARLQIDVAVNPGNSGGPLLDDKHHVIGIIVASIRNAQGINYAAPMFECLLAGARIRTNWPQKRTSRSAPYYDQTPSFNATFVKANAALAEQYGGAALSGGVMCMATHHDANVETLRGKLVLAIEAALPTCNSTSPTHIGVVAKPKLYPIDMQKTCQFNFWPGRLSFDALLDRLKPGDSVSYICANANDAKQAAMLRPPLNVFGFMYPEFDPVPYFVIGGIVIMSLRHNHIRSYREKQLDFMQCMRELRREHKSVLIITHMMPSSVFNRCGSVREGCLVDSVEGRRVETLEELSAAVDRCSHKKLQFITLMMHDGQVASARMSELTTNDSEIVSEHGQAYSAGLHEWKWNE